MSVEVPKAKNCNGFWNKGKMIISLQQYNQQVL